MVKVYRVSVYEAIVPYSIIRKAGWVNRTGCGPHITLEIIKLTTSAAINNQIGRIE